MYFKVAISLHFIWRKDDAVRGARNLVGHWRIQIFKLGCGLNTIFIKLFNIKFFFCQERNSASLLFSSLVTRIFGVKKDKQDLSPKNTMTAKLFFRQFSKLFCAFKEELIATAEHVGGTRNSSLHPDEAALYPILIIMAKLEQSSGAATRNDDIEVWQFFFHFIYSTVQ